MKGKNIRILKHKKKTKIATNFHLPKLHYRSISTILPVKENVYSKIKISDVFALEKLILPRFKIK